MRPKSSINNPKRDDEHPRHFHTGVPPPPREEYCFVRTANFIRESEGVAGNREPREIIRETAILLVYYIIYLELASYFVLISGDVSLAERG